MITQAAIFLHRRLWTAVFVAAILGLGWFSAQSILSGSERLLLLILVGFAAFVFMLRIAHDWRSGLYLFLIWLLFEDLARKYLGNNMAIYFGKDVLVGVACLSYFAALRRRETRSFRPPFLVPFLFFFFLGMMQVFNPASSSLLYGLLGLKLYFFYFPLMFLGYALIDSDRDLWRFLVVNVALAGFIALLGIIQALVGPTFLNPSVMAPEIHALSHIMRVAPISGRLVYRPTSVFVSDGRFAWYLVQMVILGLGAAGYLLLRTKRGRLPVFLCIGLLAAAIALSGSRGALLYAAGSALVVGAALLWGAPWKKQEGLRMVRAIQRSFLLAGLGITVLLLWFPSALGARWAFYSETLSLESPASELSVRVMDYPIANLIKAFQHERWVYGYGIGTASLGVQYVSRLLGQERPEHGVESGFGTLIVELGILGPFLWLAWTLALLISGWRAVKRLKGTPYFPIGFTILWFAFLLLIPFTYGGMQPYQNYVLNAYFWLLVGVMFRLPTLLITKPVLVAQPEESVPHAR